MQHERNLWWTAVAPSLLLLVVAGMAIAGSVTIPNTFTPNTVADANQVNANFDAVRLAVNDNDANIAALQTQVTALQALHATAGNIRAMAHVTSGATLGANWMANGNTPVVTDEGAGLYRVVFPGLDFSIFATNRGILANTTGDGGWATVSAYNSNAGVLIRTYNAAGVLADDDFWVVVFGAP